jgi:hypothetical protein
MVATRGRGRWGGRLLLLTALLFGIVTMHTLGHPSEEHGGSAHPATGSVTSAHQTQQAHRAHTMDGITARAPGPDAAAPTLATTSGPPVHGMDPMAVCLAVLTAWGIALLIARALLARRPQGWAEPVRDSGLLRSLWPHPPPLRVALARLSVLRI